MEIGLDTILQILTMLLVGAVIPILIWQDRNYVRKEVFDMAIKNVMDAIGRVQKSVKKIDKRLRRLERKSS